MRNQEYVLVMGWPHGENCRRQEGAKPHRQARWLARADATDDTRQEPILARRCGRSDVPTNSEIREGHQPHRLKSAAAICQSTRRVGFIFLRGSARRVVTR